MFLKWLIFLKRLLSVKYLIINLDISNISKYIWIIWSPILKALCVFSLRFSVNCKESSKQFILLEFFFCWEIILNIHDWYIRDIPARVVHMKLIELIWIHTEKLTLATYKMWWSLFNDLVWYIWYVGGSWPVKCCSLFIGARWAMRCAKDDAWRSRQAHVRVHVNSL